MKTIDLLGGEMQVIADRPHMEFAKPTVHILVDVAEDPESTYPIEELLEAIPADDYSTWIAVGRILKKLGYDFSVWDTWSQNSYKYNQGSSDYRTDTKWRTFVRKTPQGLEDLERIAYHNGWKKPKGKRLYGMPKPKDLKEELKKAYPQFGDCSVSSYDYTGESGEYKYSRVFFRGGNIDGKTARTLVLDRERGVVEEFSQGGEIPCLYNLPRLLQAIKDGYPVYFCEGEKDVETLRKHHYVATTCGSATSWRNEFARYFRGARVVFLPDNDSIGSELMKKACKEIRKYAHATKTVTVSKLPKGDISDYLEKEGGTIDGFKEMLSAVDYDGASWIYYKKDDLKINVGILSDVISQNEHYLIVRNGGDDKENLYLYDGGVYRMVNKNGFLAQIIRPYFPKSLVSPAYLDNCYKLLMSNGEHSVSLSELNTDEEHINVQNGLLNIKTGELEPHTPNIYSTTQLNVAYDKNNRDFANFDRFMRDLVKDETGAVDTDKLRLLQEICGLLLSGIHVKRFKKAFLLHSSIGNTGKTTMLSTLEFMLPEDKVKSLDLIDLDASKDKNRFKLSNLWNARLLMCGDSSCKTIYDSSIFKRLTGGDRTETEAKGKDSVNVRFNGGIVVACNRLPVFADDKGSHVTERLLVVPFFHSVPLSQRDMSLVDRLEEEKTAIFNFYFEGLQRLVRNGMRFSPCKASNVFLEEYRESSDNLYGFLKECYDLTFIRSDVVSKTDLYNDYIRWCASSEIEYDARISKKDLDAQMTSYGLIFDKKVNTPTARGVAGYRGLKRKPISALLPKPEDLEEIPPFEMVQ